MYIQWHLQIVFITHTYHITQSVLRNTPSKSTFTRNSAEINHYILLRNALCETVTRKNVYTHSFKLFSNVKYICAERRTTAQAPSVDHILLSFDRPPPFWTESLCEEVSYRFVVDNSIHVSAGTGHQSVWVGELAIKRIINKKVHNIEQWNFTRTAMELNIPFTCQPFSLKTSSYPSKRPIQ